MGNCPKSKLKFEEAGTVKVMIGTAVSAGTVAELNTWINWEETLLLYPNIPYKLPAAASMVQSTSLEASHVIKAAAGNLYGIFGYSNRVSSHFIQLFNSATVLAATAVPIITFAVP